MGLPSTGSEVMRALNGLRSYYSQMHSEMLGMDDIYNLKFAVQAPNDFPVVIPGTGRRHADRMVAHIAAGKLRLYRPPRKAGKSYQEEADEVEKWAHVIYNRLPKLSRRRMRLPPFWGAVKYAVIRGYGAVKNPPDPEYLQPEPERRQGEDEETYERRLSRWQRMRANGCPIACVSVDPLILFPDPDGRYVIEDVRISKEAAENQLGKTINAGGVATPPGMQSTNQVRWTECWTPERKIICVNGAEYLNVVNPVGFVPYSFILPGFGEPNVVQSHLSGLAAGPELVHKSFLYIVKSELEELARRETQTSAIMHASAWRVIALYPDKDWTGDRDEHPQFSMYPGEINELRGWIAKPVDLGDFPEELFAQLQHIQLDIAENTLPPIASGMSQGEKTAYQSQIYLGVARLIMDGLNQATEACIEESIEQWLMLAEWLGEDVEVWGPYRKGWEKISLSPEKIAGWYAIDAQLTPSLPQDELARRSQYIKEWQAGATSWNEMQEQGLGNEDPEDVRLEVLADKQIQSPQVEQLLGRQAAEHLGWDIEEIMAAEEERQERLAGGQGPSPEQIAQLAMRQGGGGGLAAPGSAYPAAQGLPAGQPVAPGSNQEIDLLLRQIMRQRAPQPRRPV